MSGIIKSKERINIKRGFAEATEYVGCHIQDASGVWVPALFTLPQLTVAIERANLQPEDIEPEPSLFRRLLARFI
jgi:hypothetical protein